MRTLMAALAVVVLCTGCAPSDLGSHDGIHLAYTDSVNGVVCYHDHGNAYGGDAISCVKVTP